MKKNRYIQGFLALCFMATLTTGCEINDILKEDDGSDMALIRVDLPTFDAEYVLNFTDVMTGQPYEKTLTANIFRAGVDEICTDMGKLKDGKFTTSTGTLNLFLNPNKKVAGETISFEVDGKGSDYIIIRHKVNTVKGRNDASIGVFSLNGTRASSSVLVASEHKPAYKIVDANGVEANVSWFNHPTYHENKLVKGIILGDKTYKAINIPENMVGVSVINHGGYSLVYEEYKISKKADVIIKLSGTGETSGTYRITTKDGVSISNDISGKLPI